MKRASTIMLQGTASDVGKSLLATALCRIFWQDGYLVAPFKSQNMSNNSSITPDGKEIGRAQAMQAEACHVAATTDMSPILLKPRQDMVSQVIVHGEPYRDFDARTYRETYLDEAGQIVRDALERLRSDKDIVVIEGAGSPAEINLKDRDIVNMNLAKWADAPVLLVADIDRGGVFASIVGTLELLTPDERARVAGFIINKFRGDVSLLKPGLDWLEERTGKPVIGVIPYLSHLTLEDEDLASLDARQARLADRGSIAKETSDLSSARSTKLTETTRYAHTRESNRLEIAVVKLPRMANFTDVNPLLHEPDVQVRFIDKASDLGAPDAVIIPSTMNAASDLQYLHTTGLAQKLIEYAASGGHCVGIGAGYHMMGQRMINSERPEVSEQVGFGWLAFDTKLTEQKRTVRVAGSGKLPRASATRSEETAEYPVSGYVIESAELKFDNPHAPETSSIAHQSGAQSAHVKPLFTITHESGQKLAAAYGDGTANETGRVWGTHIHGMMHNDLFRRAWLNELREKRGWTNHPEPIAFGQLREREFDRLADHVRKHLAMDRIYQLLDI